MTVTTKIEKVQRTLCYDNGRVLVTTAVPQISTYSLLTDNMISQLISAIEKCGILKIDDVTIINQNEVCGILDDLKSVRKDKIWCYLCDVNSNGYVPCYNVMRHSRRLPRK